MFLRNQSKEQVEYYQKMLTVVGSLSRLFSESNEPYVAYRMAENLFCKSFMAKNLSRNDYSVDASKNALGIGIKTFLEKNGSTWQKIAEFNKAHSLFSGLEIEHQVNKLAELRNARIEATKRICGLEKLIYHCVTREESAILVYETPMDLVVSGKIQAIKVKENTVRFSDALNEYSFNIPKSTLYKRFHTKDVILNFPVKILENPFDALGKIFLKEKPAISFAPIRKRPHVILPLYSMKHGERIVREKSGLNQWNASGRKRDSNEIYIPIPAWIHHSHPDFFPNREASFTLILPNGKEMSAKVCQDSSKALMSNPNSALGQWLLRGILNLKEGELLTYGKLAEIGLDSVAIYNVEGEAKYSIDFTRVGSYELFQKQTDDYDESEQDIKSQ